MRIDPLLKLAKDVVPKEQKLPYDQFGLLYGKNGTSPDNYTIFTGQSDITKYGMLEKWNGKLNLGHWKTDECDSVMGTDGSIFPPHITKNTVLKVFDKDRSFVQLYFNVYVNLLFAHIILAIQQKR